MATAAALGFRWVMENLLDHNRLLAVVLGGVSLVVVALLVHRVKDIAETGKSRAKALSGYLTAKT
ncbi:MAG: hypothetical protein BRC36_14975 [Cyanobacteria bacterium QH_2_48_84]|nr:MAG: hypothetical protein BRC36_14975 [Cyanobacteria bacterium QH_2_48_84]